MTRTYFALFRLLTSFLFLYAGTKHLLHPGKIFTRISSSTAYSLISSEQFFTASIYLSGVVMIVAGFMLLLGYQQKWAAMALLLVLVPITLTVQLENLNDLGPFFKNIAVSGSLLFIINYKQNEIEQNHTGNSRNVISNNRVRAEKNTIEG